jgi:Zn-dependent protease with chaperone function
MRLYFAVLALLLTSALPGIAALGSDPAARRDDARLQEVVDRLCRKLSIPHPVIVTLVAQNPLVASVQPDRERKGTFVLSIERGFLDDLSDDEVEAVVAHELGHVWIYTHHPYLQTEQLANRIAMRVVMRETLARVYGKVWGAKAMDANLASFLGVPGTSTPAVEAGLAPGAARTSSAPRQ